MNKKIKTALRHPLCALVVFINNRKKILIKDDFKYLNILSKMTDLNMDLTHPLTFNSKLQYLKLHDRNPAYTEMVDKAAAKDYVVRTLKAAGVQAPEQYIIPTLAQYRTWDEIDFAALPSQFVLKCTHDSGGLVIVKNKDEFLADPARVRAAKRKLAKSLKRNFYYSGREWPYKNVPPRIIAEKYMQNKDDAELMDYKIFCFAGQPKYIQVIANRRTNETIDFFDFNWEHQPFTGLGLPEKPFAASPIPIPIHFKDMEKYAQILSKDMAFSRIDFYEINGKLYFGEITFYPASGFGVFSSYDKNDKVDWNQYLGDLIDLSLAYDNQKK